MCWPTLCPHVWTDNIRQEQEPNYPHASIPCSSRQETVYPWYCYSSHVWSTRTCMHSSDSTTYKHWTTVGEKWYTTPYTQYYSVGINKRLRWSLLIEVTHSSLYMYKRRRERKRGKKERVYLFEKERVRERVDTGRVCHMDMRYPVILLTERIIIFLYLYVNKLLVHTRPQSKTEHWPCTTS